MCKINATMILSLLAVAVVVIEPIDSRIAYTDEVTQKDENTLISLTPEQALPLIFFYGEGQNNIPGFPMGLTQVEIEDGRLTSGTEFYTMPPSRPALFCPLPKIPKEVAAFEVGFKNKEELECDHQPEPTMEEAVKNKYCGERNNGVLIEYLYKVMFVNAAIKGFETKNIPIYKLCYHELDKKVLYIEYKTVSAKLLSEKSLAKEREIEFQGDLISEYYDQIHPDYHIKLGKERDSNPDYEFQKMLPPKYMALYSWRKTAYHYVNVALMHKNLIALWNEIHTNIIANVMQTHQLPRTITTGVKEMDVYNKGPPREENQMYNIWVTLITDTNVENNYKGLAILMHNFVTTKASQDKGSSAYARNKQLYIDGLCGQDLCVDSLKRKFEGIGGQVRCCKVTAEIQKLFGKSDDYKSIDRVLEIRDITYCVSLECFFKLPN